MISFRAITVLLQVHCDDGPVVQAGDDQIYSIQEKLPRKVQGKVKVLPLLSYQSCSSGQHAV